MSYKCHGIGVMQLISLTSDGLLLIGRTKCISHMRDKAYPVIAQCDQSHQQKWHYDNEVSDLLSTNIICAYYLKWIYFFFLEKMDCE